MNGTAEARDANAYEYVHAGGDGAAHTLAAAQGAAHFKSAVNIVKVTNRFQLAGKVCYRAQSALARACNRVRVRVRAHARTARGKGCGREGKGIAHSGGAQ